MKILNKLQEIIKSEIDRVIENIIHFDKKKILLLDDSKIWHYPKLNRNDDYSTRLNLKQMTSYQHSKDGTYIRLCDKKNYKIKVDIYEFDAFVSSDIQWGELRNGHILCGYGGTIWDHLNGRIATLHQPKGMEKECQL